MQIIFSSIALPLTHSADEILKHDNRIVCDAKKKEEKNYTCKWKNGNVCLLNLFVSGPLHSFAFDWNWTRKSMPIQLNRLCGSVYDQIENENSQSSAKRSSIFKRRLSYSATKFSFSFRCSLACVRVRIPRARQRDRRIASYSNLLQTQYECALSTTCHSFRLCLCAAQQSIHFYSHVSKCL